MSKKTILIIGIILCIVVLIVGVSIAVIQANQNIHMVQGLVFYCRQVSNKTSDQCAEWATTTQRQRRNELLACINSLGELDNDCVEQLGIVP